MAKRNTALDVLRALAVLLVIGRHAMPPASYEPFWVRAVMAPWIAGGWVGVDLFFVISGFLVGGLLFRERRDSGRVAPGHFLIRRGFKIYPAFYLMLACTVTPMIAEGIQRPAVQVVSELFFLQSYSAGIWNHTWSLAVEEHFYILLALLATLVTARRAPAHVSLRHVLGSYALIAAVCLLLRLRLSSTLPYSNLTHMFATHLRIDSLFYGVLLSHVQCFHEAALRRFVARFRLPLVLVSLALLSIAFVLPLGRSRFLITYGFTLIAWGSGGVVVVAYCEGLPDHWVVRGLARIGADSYSIYLWHMAVFRWVVPTAMGATGLDVPYAAAMLFYVVASIVAGIWLARAIEQPVLRVRDHYFPSRAMPLAGVPMELGTAA